MLAIDLFTATLEPGMENFLTHTLGVGAAVTFIPERYHLPLIHLLYTFLSPWQLQ